MAHPLPNRAWLAGLLLAGLSLPAADALADRLYKWTDENGVTHYTDSPPPDRAYETRSVDPDAAEAASAERREAAEQDGAAADAPASPVDQNCTRVRANLATLESAAGVTMDLDGDGTAEELTPEQRAEQLELAQRQVEAYCGQAEPPQE